MWRKNERSNIEFRRSCEIQTKQNNRNSDASLWKQPLCCFISQWSHIHMLSTGLGGNMHMLTFEVGDLVYDTHIEKVGLVTHVFDEIAYRVLFAEGEYTCFIEDLEELCE